MQSAVVSDGPAPGSRPHWLLRGSVTLAVVCGLAWWLHDDGEFLQALLHTSPAVILALLLRALVIVATNTIIFVLLLRPDSGLGTAEIALANLRSQIFYVTTPAAADVWFFGWMLRRSRLGAATLARLAGYGLALRVGCGLLALGAALAASGSLEAGVSLGREVALLVSGVGTIVLAITIALAPRFGASVATALWIVGLLVIGVGTMAGAGAVALGASGLGFGLGDRLAAAVIIPQARYLPLGIAGIGLADVGWVALFASAGLRNLGGAFTLVDAATTLAAHLAAGALGWVAPRAERRGLNSVEVEARVPLDYSPGISSWGRSDRPPLGPQMTRSDGKGHSQNLKKPLKLPIPTGS